MAIEGQGMLGDIINLRRELAAALARAERAEAACRIGLGVIVRSDLKGREPREAIAALTAALAAIGDGHA